MYRIDQSLYIGTTDRQTPDNGNTVVINKAGNRFYLLRTFQSVPPPNLAHWIAELKALRDTLSSFRREVGKQISDSIPTLYLYGFDGDGKTYPTAIRPKGTPPPTKPMSAKSTIRK